MRTYVITGAASGIGRATAELLTGQGHTVIGVDVHDADVTADLGTRQGRAQMVSEVADRSGGTVDAVIANAGVSTNSLTALTVNYYGAIATLEGLRPYLLRSDAPRAAATASMASLLPVSRELLTALLEGTEEEALALAEPLATPEGNTMYSTSKQALVKWLRRAAPTPEWAGAGIPLNAIAPGIIRTAMTAPLFATEEGRQQMAAAVPMPLNGPAEPEVCAEVLAFLTSPANTHMCGQVLFVDGGSDAVIRGDSVW